MKTVILTANQPLIERHVTMGCRFTMELKVWSAELILKFLPKNM